MTNTTPPDIQHLLTRQIHIATLNVNGIQNNNKRTDTFELIRNSNIDIALLQETHYTPKAVKMGERVERKIPLAFWTHIKSIGCSNIVQRKLKC